MKHLFYFIILYTIFLHVFVIIAYKDCSFEYITYYMHVLCFFYIQIFPSICNMYSYFSFVLFLNVLSIFNLKRLLKQTLYHSTVDICQIIKNGKQIFLLICISEIKNWHKTDAVLFHNASGKRSHTNTAMVFIMSGSTKLWVGDWLK